ncbi:FG-GAP-like repeat-containing protein [Candidatus Fukatsuia endosymbiont of Drepanosiphum platanoidis]|uniref:FG-GAP-like repeat-containing protein n=1 Tax=Candidatus Fukatsuia endosymbiont of Drepanosiphum platanoidis TaxID=3077953 RepID=UPI00313D3E00
MASLIKNRWQFQLFINNTQHLLQSPRAQRQLATSSGKKALLQSHIWHEKQSDVIATWHGIATEQGSVNLKLAPQALFIGDGSPYARASATATSLAWLDSQAQGGNASENYLNGLNNYADIHEQRAEGPLSDNDTQQVQQLDPLFDRLLAVPEDHPRVFIRQSLPTTYADVALGHYLLNIGSDTLTLSKSNDGFSLYDPTVGTLRIAGPKANQILTTTLQTYLRPVSPGPTGDQQPALPPITLYKVDMAAAQTHFPTLAPLQDLLSDYQTETQRLANAADITLSEVVIPARILNKMGARVRGKPFAMQHLTQADLADQLSFDAKKLSRYLHQADYNDLATQQAVRFLKQQIASKGSVESVLVADGDAQSRVSALAQLQKIHQYVTPMLNPEALPDQHLTDHTAKLTLQIDPTLGATVKAVPVAPRWGRTQRLSSRLGGTMQGYGYLRALSDMAKYDALLQSDTLTAKQKEQITFEKNLAMSSLITNLVIDVTQEGLGRWGNRLTRLGVRSGFKLQLARFGGPALGVLSSGFDIYQALRAFSELAATTDPKLRQDLIVTGSLSTAGALVSIGVPIAFAVGGTAASVAGPLGITVGAALLLAGAIYSAVREVENIKKILTLTDWETLRSGWFAFTGQDQEPHIANQLMRHETEQAAQRILQEKRQETAIALLRANINIETLYLSLGQPDLAERSYDKVTAMGENGREILRDKISPKETVNPRTLAESTLIPNQNAEYHWGRNLYYRDGQLEPSAYKYYDVQFSSADDVVNSAGEVSAQVLKKPFMGVFNQVGTFFRQEEGKQKTQLPGLNPRQNDYRSVMSDFNGDGQQDIGYFSTQGLSLLLADGKGGYAQPQLIEKGKLIDGLTVHTLVGDIDHDGKDDIVITIGSGEPIRILLAKENNTFIEKPQPIRLALSYSSDAAPVLLDIDRDGHADLVSWSRQLTPAVNTVKDPRGYINISYGKADGTFERSASLPFSQLKVPQAAVSAHTHHVAGDINGDGYGDLVTLTAEGNLYTLLGTGDRANPFKAQDVQQHQGMTQLARNFNTAQIQLRDMNNDNRADLVLIQDNGNHSIAYGKSDGYFAINTEVKPQQGQPRQNLLALRNEHQILGIRTDAQGNNQLLSLNKAGEINAHPFTSTPPEERVAWFSLGGGNDDAMGHQEQKNIFEVGAGKKRFIGGRKADTFLLMGQAAPQDQRHASVLNGGDLSPSDNADTVMAAIKRDGSGGYHIDLTAGIARYRSSEKIIAKLQQIEHADGHSETDDELMGNSADNKLNGMGGRDVLNGYAGNDWLTLQAGQANGGVGIDTYRILQSHSNAQVVLSDTPNTQEHSAVLLDYLAADIVSITMEDADVVLTLRNKNKTHTQVFLRDMYSARVGNQRTLQHNYALYTYDGLHLTGWPSTLSPKSEGSVPSLPNLTARYIAIHDRSRAAALKTVQPGGDVSAHLQVVDGRGQVEIKVNDQPVSSHADNSPTVLPSFLQLALVGTKFHTTLTGDNKDNYLTALPLSGREDTNRLWHQYSYDTLMGKGGADTYEIGRSERGIWIDNEDDGSATGGEAAQDRLLLPWSLKETQLIQAGNDIVLRHRDTSASYPIIRIRHFMQDERYRHLWLQEKNGLLAELFINQGQVVIGRVDVSEQDDHVVVLHESALIDKKIALLDGDDSFSDLSDTDCQITGGRGDDTLLGGAGNNVYCYATGDGHDAVQDKGGNDRLDFTSAEINKDALWLEKVGYDLRVRVKGRGSSEGVTIKNHYRGADSRIEKIIAGGFQLSGNSIDQLAETMASFSTTASVSSPSTSSLSTQINRHWITVSAA